MYKMPKIVLGVAPTKRGFLSMEEAKRQKDAFMAVIRGIDSDVVDIVDIDDFFHSVDKMRSGLFIKLHSVDGGQSPFFRNGSVEQPQSSFSDRSGLVNIVTKGIKRTSIRHGQ